LSFELGINTTLEFHQPRRTDLILFHSLQSFTDKFWAWAHEMVGSSKHGDLVRLLAGARSAAKQIEYMKEYGTSHPPEYLPKGKDDEVDVS